MVKPKFYYHITQKKWPERVKLIPRSEGEHRLDNEPLIERICVSPTIEGCLVALGSCLLLSRPIYIYRTIKKVSVKNPYRVLDSHVTKEKWIIKPIKFMKIGKINKFLPKELYYLSAGGHDDHKFQYNMLNNLKEMNLNFVDFT